MHKLVIGQLLSILKKLRSCSVQTEVKHIIQIIIFDNTQLSFVENHKHLGVYINSKGKWDKHINYIINKCARLLVLMRSMEFKMSRIPLNRMYLSYIRPILEYADVLWDGCSNENESRIEKVQLEAARLVSGLPRSTSTDRIYHEVGWKTLHHAAP